MRPNVRDANVMFLPCPLPYDKNYEPACRPLLEDLLALFPPADDIRNSTVISADDVPRPYHALLVHKHHMTVTVEKHHGDLVDVRVLAVNHHGDTYARKILLALQKTGRIVQAGAVRIHLEHCSPAVRAEILEQRTPLGRILIRHNVLRRIEPTAYLKIEPGAGHDEMVQPERADAGVRAPGDHSLRRSTGHRGTGDRDAGVIRLRLSSLGPPHAKPQAASGNIMLIIAD